MNADNKSRRDMYTHERTTTIQKHSLTCTQLRRNAHSPLLLAYRNNNYPHKQTHHHSTTIANSIINLNRSEYYHSDARPRPVLTDSS